MAHEKPAQTSSEPRAGAWEVDGLDAPISEAELRRRVADGSLASQTRVRPRGTAGWRPAAAALSRRAGAVWQALLDGRKRGPYTVDEIRERVAQGEWSIDTPVWRPGLAEWAPIRSHAELTATLPPAALAPDPTAARRLELERLVRRAPDAETRQAALVELGRLALADDEPDVAIARFRQALAARPDDEAPFLGLEGVYRERRAWAALFDLYKQRARATQGAARGRVMERVGALAAGALKRPDKAIEAYRKALTLGGDRPEPLRQLLGLLADAGRDPEAADVALRLAKVAEAPEARLRARIRAAELLGDSQPARAAQLMRPVIDAHPDDVRHRLALWRLLLAAQDPKADDAGAWLVERLPASHKAWPDLLQTHAERLTAAGRADEALAVWRRLLDEQPEHPQALAAVHAAEAQDDPAAQVDARLDEVSRLDPAEQLLALRALAQEVEAELPGAAARVWQAVLALRPSDHHAQAQLEAHLKASADHQAHLALLVERLDRTRGDGRRLALYREIAALFERQLDEPEGAWTALVDAFRETFADEQLGPDLDRLGRRLGRTPELVELYEDTLALFEDGAPVAGLHCRVGRWLTRMEQAPRALAHFEAALALAPTSPEPVNGMLGLMAQGDLAAARRVAPLLAQAEDWERLHAVRRRLAGAEASGPARAQALVALADLCVERLGRPDEAAAWLGEALVEHPADTRTFDRLRAVVAHLPVDDVLDDALGRAVEAATSPTDAARLGRALAHHRAAADDLTGAASAWRAVLAAAPNDPEALAALDAHLTAGADAQALVPILEQRLASARGDERRQLARRLAEAAEGLGDTGARQQALWHALDGDPCLAGARRTLIGLLTAEADWAGVHAALEPATGIGDAAARAAAHTELAELCAGTLERPAEAVDHWRAVQDLVGESEGTLAALRALHQRLDAPSAEVAVLAQLAARSEPRAAASHHADRARLLEAALSDLEGAAAAWQAALAADPEHPEAPWALHRLWQREGPAAEHAAALDVLLGRIEPDDKRAVDLFRSRARLRANALGDAPGAIADFEAVRARKPDDGEALRRLAALYGEAGDTAPLVDVLRAQARGAEAEQAVALRLRIARLDDGAAGDEALRAVLAADPANKAAHDGLAERLEARGHWPALVALLEARAEAAPADAHALLDQAAALTATHLSDPDRALSLLLPTLPERATDGELCDRLAHAAAACDRWGDLVAAGDEALGALGAARHPLALRVAYWVEVGLGDGPAAVERLRALLDGPQADAALTQLEAMVQRGHAAALAAQAAAPRLEAKRAWVRLYPLLAGALDATAGEARAQTLQRLAHLAAEDLRRPADAWRWYAQAFHEAPSEPAPRQALEGFAAKTDRFADLAQAYEQALAATQDADLVKRLGHRAADLAAGRLKQPDEAERLWCLVLDRADPADRASLDGLRRLWRPAGRHVDLAERLDAAAAVEGLPDGRRLPLLLEAGEAWAEAERTADAIARFEAVVAEIPDHPRALSKLEALRDRAGDRAGLLEVLRRRAPQAPGDMELRVRAARLATELDQAEEAIGWWQAALDLGADERTALAALEPLCLRAERWAQLAETCERRRSLARDEQAIVRLDRRLGELYAERLDRPADALAAWASVLRRRPDDLQALWASRAGYAQVGDDGARAQVDQRLLELLPADDPQRPTLWAALAETYERLEQPDDAAAAWQALLEAHPAHPEAEQRLEALARARGDWATVADQLGARAERVEGAAQADAWLAVAELAEGPLADAERARGALIRAAEARPDDAALLDRLEAAHTAAEAWTELAQLLDHRAASAPPPARAAWLRRAAQVREARLGRVSEALGQVAESVQLLPDPAGLDELERLAEAAQGWPAAADAVRAALGAEPAPATEARLQARLAAWLAGPLDAPAEALTLAQAVAAAHPDDPEAHATVGALLTRLARHDALAEWLATPAPEEPSDAARARQIRLAELQADALHDRHAALATWRALLDADANDTEALAAVERLSAELDDWAGLAELCRAHAERVSDPATRSARFQRLGDLYAGPLDLPAAALGAYREALAAHPENAAAAAAFEAFCLQAGHLDALNAWYAEQQGVAPNGRRAGPQAPAPSAEALPEPSMPEFEIPVDDLAPADGLTIGDEPIAESLPPQDLQAMDAALVAPPAPSGLLVDRATRALEAAYRGEGRWSELAALYRRRLAVTRDAEQATALEGALLDLYLGPADDPGRAAELLERRLADERSPRFLLEQITDLQRRAGDGAGLARTLRARAELSDLAEADRLALFDELARVHQDLLNDRTAARGWWQAALEFDPGYAPALQGLKGALISPAPAEAAPSASAPAAPTAAQISPPRRAAEPLDPAQVKRYRVRRANPARRRKIITGLAVFGVFWALVATGAFIIQSMRLDRTTDEMATANRAYTRLAKEVNTTQARFTEVAQALNKQHGDGTPIEMYAAEPVDIPDGEASVLTDRILGIAINDIKMRGAVHAMRDLVSGVVEQREIAVAQAEDLKARLDGVSTQLASLEGKKEVADELLAQRLDENIEQLEVALDITGLDAEGLLAPNLVVPPEGQTEGAVGGPWAAGSVAYASPLPGKTQVMSGFGHRGHEHHNGIDIPGPIGTPVRSVADGEVVFVQDRPTWDKRPKFITRNGKRIKSPGWRAGVYVEIQHADGRVSRYLHLDDVANGIEPGVRVRKRQVIGTLGRTAVEHSRTHLHFELREPSDNPKRRWGAPVDPEAPLSNPDPNRVAQGVQALKDRTARLSAIVTGAPFEEAGLGLEGDDEAPVAAKDNATAQVLGSLGLQGRVSRLQGLEKVLRAMPLVAPVDDFKISSGFGKRQDPMHPSETGLHTGLDIPGKDRTPVMATAPGTVSFSGWKGGFGRVVEIDHGHGLVTRYAHLYKSLVRVGQRVTLREKIGQMGSTGRSTGTHLHYEVQVDGKPTDPLRFLKAGRAIFDK